MKTCLAAFAFAAAIVQPAAAITFPKLTTIYIGSGVLDNGAGADTGTASIFFCSNVSGASANVRVLILSRSGPVLASATEPVSHGQSVIFATHATHVGEILLATGFVSGGTVNIESTQSAVFCRAAVMNAAGPSENSSPIDLVRVNPHPGTVE
jgi:hypothetical protein